MKIFIKPIKETCTTEQGLPTTEVVGYEVDLDELEGIFRLLETTMTNYLYRRN